MSEELGLTCILPDFFRGQSWPNISHLPTWQDSLSQDWEFKLLPYLLERGAQSVATVGTCFGSYIVIHTSGDGFGLIKAGISIHPSHPGQSQLH